MQVTIRRRLECEEPDLHSAVVSLSVDIPFVPETRTKIFDSVVDQPVEVLDVMLDFQRPSGEQLTVFLEPLRLKTDYELIQWLAQYEARGWQSSRRQGRG
jgi:hypothetical protein